MSVDPWVSRRRYPRSTMPSSRRAIPATPVIGLGLALAFVLAAGTLAACDPTPGSAGTVTTSPTVSATAPGDLPPNASTAPTSEPSPTPRGRAGLPDPRLTPGATNPDVTPANIGTTICRSGWSKSVRPPVAYTGPLKRRQIVEYGYRDRDPSHYQEDHLVPLSLGGAPRDPRNLWPEPLVARLPDGTNVGANTKDDFEFSLYSAVCDGRVTLRDAQRTMATDWIAGWEAAGRP